MVYVEEQGGYLQGGKVTPGTNGLSSNILHGLTGIEPHCLILRYTQAPDDGDYGLLWNLPDGVSLVIVQLGSSVK